MASMGIALFGPVTLFVDGEPVPLGGPMRRAVLAYLALHQAEPVPVERMLADLWGPDATAGARHSLQTYVSTLRKLLAPVESCAITLGPAGYRLEFDASALDLHRFERTAARAFEHGDASLAAEALAVWRAEPLEDLPDAPWARAALTALQETRRSVALLHLDALLAAGQNDQLLQEIGDHLQVAPFDERLWARRLLALYRSGRQSEALAAYQHIEQALREELGLAPGPELRALQRRILLHDPGLAGPGAPPHRVPASISSFVGRSSELEQLVELTHAHRLITIAGPGGVGKTRTAIELAHLRRGGPRDGVFFIDLAPLADATRIATEIAAHLAFDLSGDGSIPELVERLRPLSCLLVLDNAEHLRSEVADIVAASLQGAEGVRIVVTSRVALGLTGEVVWRLPPLELPREDDDAADLVRRDAVKLLAQRAREVRPAFQLGPTNLASVTAICVRLDGLPLAIEIAASRLRSMAVSEIAARLDRDLNVLRSSDPTAAPRHRTLEAVLRWSTDPLAPSTRRTFARLAVVPGGFDQETAAAVCGCDVDEVTDDLAALVDHSLLTVDTSGVRSRYRMLEVVRDHAGQLLTASGELRDARLALLGWTLELSGQAMAGLTGPSERTWVERLSADRALLRAGLAAGMAEDPGGGLRLAKRLVRFWWANAGDADVQGQRERPTLYEGIEWLERFLDVAEVDVRTRGAAEVALGWFLGLTGRQDRARHLLSEVQERMDAAGEVRLAGWAALYAATSSWSEPPAEVIPGYEDAYERFDVAGAREGQMLTALLEYAYTAAWLGTIAARQALERFLAFTEGSISSTLQVYRSGVIATEELAEGRFETARAPLLQAMDANRTASDPATTSLLLWLSAWYAASIGETRLAALALTVGDQVESRYGLAMPPRLLYRAHAVAALGGELDADAASDAAAEAGGSSTAEVLARLRALVVC
jgi:predicted ATPase/DNA-binding SARP family transcriptional activator